jgi:hypothetical protein
MNRALAFILAALALWLPTTAALAQSGARVIATTSWVEEWDPASQRWVRIADGPVSSAIAANETTTQVTRAGGVTITETVHAETVVAEPGRFIPQTPRMMPGLARFGPFLVLDSKRVALVASTDAASPAAFAAMLAAYPGLEVIEFTDAPGTRHDLANLKLGRAIRAAGLATHVPAGGSARSGAVELFLAGTRRTVEPGALFAVHSWRDERGREPADFAPDAPENRLYLDYYTEMGMSLEEAYAFYAMTNSVPHAGARWLEGDEMARWLTPRAPAAQEWAPVIEAPLRLALARSGAALADAVRLPQLRLSQPEPAPQLAYADLGAGPLPLLDSVAAFP